MMRRPELSENPAKLMAYFTLPPPPRIFRDAFPPSDLHPPLVIDGSDWLVSGPDSTVAITKMTVASLSTPVSMTETSLSVPSLTVSKLDMTVSVATTAYSVIHKAFSISYLPHFSAKPSKTPKPCFIFIPNGC